MTPPSSGLSSSSGISPLLITISAPLDIPNLPNAPPVRRGMTQCCATGGSRARCAMADSISIEARSRVMATVKAQHNKATELRLIDIMRAAGIKGWRRNSNLPGRPDFVFPKARLAVFVDGCFWHGCPVHCRKPSSNRRYWTAKLARNQRRDREVSNLLRRRNWIVLRIWEHSLSRPRQVAKRLLSYFDG